MGSLPVLPNNRFPGIPRRQSPVILSSDRHNTNVSRSFAGRTEALKAKSTSGTNALEVQDSSINPKEHNRISVGSLPVTSAPGIPRRQSPVIPSSEVGSADKKGLRRLHESCRGVS